MRKLLDERLAVADSEKAVQVRSEDEKGEMPLHKLARLKIKGAGEDSGIDLKMFEQIVRVRKPSLTPATARKPATCCLT